MNKEASLRRISKLLYLSEIQREIKLHICGYNFMFKQEDPKDTITILFLKWNFKCIMYSIYF